MLRLAGAPTIQSELVSDIRLMTGTLWHTWVGEQLVRKGLFFAQEVKVNAGLPTGWSGTADWIFWDPSARGFVLGDLKTIKGEGMKWIETDGAKEEHLWQLSAYWHALYNMGLPMVEGFSILYWPMNDVPDKNTIIFPSVQECSPLDRDVVIAEMEARWELSQAYMNSLDGDYGLQAFPHMGYHTDALAPEMERVQKCYWSSKTKKWDVKLMRHWSTAYCPYPSTICACNEQTENKMGEYYFNHNGDLMYEARAGYENVEPTVYPSVRDTQKRRQEAVSFAS